MSDYDDVRQAIERMTDGEYAQFKEISGYHFSRDDLLHLYRHKPERLPHLHEHLGLKTRQEKLDEAAIASSRAMVDAAESARSSAEAAENSAFWTKVAAFIALLALIVSIVSIGISIQIATKQ